MKSYEFSAKTVEKAIKEGLESLGKNQEDVDIKILSEGGFLRKAKVVINIEEDNGATNFVKEEPKQEKSKQVEEVEKIETSILNNASSDEIKNKPEITVAKKEIVKNIEDNQKNETIKEEKTVKAKKDEAKEKNFISPEEKEKRFEERHFENNKGSKQFVSQLVNLMGVTDAKITLEEKKDCSFLKLETSEPGKVIGYRGESLYAIQYLTNVVECKTNHNAKRVVVDAGDYRQKREEDLRNLAIRIAGKVEESGRPYKLDPMGAFERRIIHTELQNYPSIETHSEGVEPYRHIVVTKK